jgi:predicted house-cleaning noncanonical NTP pyrophosphatase (MazG superfamily)
VAVVEEFFVHQEVMVQEDQVVVAHHLQDQAQLQLVQQTLVVEVVEVVTDQVEELVVQQVVQV